VAERDGPLVDDGGRVDRFALEPLARRSMLATVLGTASLAALPAVARPASAVNTAKPVPGAGAALSRRSFRTSDRVQLSWLTAGVSSRLDPFVFVPGWCMPADIFEPQLKALSRTRNVRALDPRGQGQSQAPDHGYDADRRARDLFEFLGTMKRPPIVVAWSLGGIEMLHGLRLFGEARIKALVLVDSSLGEGPAGNGDGVRAFRAQLNAERHATLEGFARAIYRTAQSDEHIAHLTDAMERVPLQPSLDMLDYGLSRDALRQTGRTLRKPLLLAITPQYRTQAALHQQARPATRLEMFEEAGHALFGDAPERFNQLLEDFARSVGAAKGTTVSTTTATAKKR
jgi:microsomal epoxide hydrolase